MKHKKVADAPPTVAGQITLDVQDVSQDLYLRSALITGSYKDHRKKVEFKVDALLNTGSPLVCVQGKQYLVNMAKLAEAVLELHRKAAKGGRDA